MIFALNLDVINIDILSIYLHIFPEQHNFRTKPFNPFEDNLFRGKTVCVSQLSANDCKILWALITYNGGTFRLTLDFHKTTHLIITKPSGVSCHIIIYLHIIIHTYML